jgi:hypothetical protein
VVAAVGGRVIGASVEVRPIRRSVTAGAVTVLGSIPANIDLVVKVAERSP